MINQKTTTELATVKAVENRVLAFEAVEKLIEMRCNEILGVAGKGNFDHPLMTGFFELQSLKGKIEGMKNIQRNSCG